MGAEKAMPVRQQKNNNSFTELEKTTPYLQPHFLPHLCTCC